MKFIAVGPHSRQVHVSRSFRCTKFPIVNSQISFREMRLLATGKRARDCYVLCTWSCSLLEFVTVCDLHAMGLYA